MATKTLLTADDLLALPNDGLRHELVGGELRTLTPAGLEHGAIVMRLAGRVWQFVEANGLGVVYGAETGFRLASDPDTVRAPDLAFVSAERVAEVTPKHGFGTGAPDLAAEVVSPGDSYSEVEEKVLDWLRAGTRLVWVIDPRTRTVAVHGASGNASILTDVLTGGDVIPDFECRVPDLFA